MTQPAEPTLVTVSLETSLGARYVFPDVERQVFEKFSQMEGLPDNMGQFQLVNASFAILSVPARIIEKVLIDDKEVWCKASPA